MILNHKFTFTNSSNKPFKSLLLLKFEVCSIGEQHNRSNAIDCLSDVRSLSFFKSCPSD